MKKPKVLTVGRKVLLACLAAAIGVSANLQATPAHAADVDAIDGSSITILNETRPNEEIRVNDDLRIEANWSIPDQSGQAGDTFSLDLPEALRGRLGNFNLTPEGQDAPVFGTCEVQQTKVLCTLTSEVVGKSNVRGRLWFASRAETEHTGSNLTFTLNGNTPVQVPLPNNAQGIGYDPSTPQELTKLGYFIDDDTLTWRIVIPGKVLAGQNQLNIHDPYGNPGTNFTVEGGWLYKIPSTPKCWNSLYDPTCRTELWSKEGASSPGTQVNYDDAIDKVVAQVNGPFDENSIYTLHLDLKVDGPVVHGSEFENAATVNGQAVKATATKQAAGGGTGQGDAVGHIQLAKKLDGDNTVPADTVFPVKFSFERAGQPVTGTLELKADGTPVVLRNIVNGTVVTFTEEVPTVAGNTFGDPVFSGGGVNDGGAASASATVAAQGTKTLELTLTNPVTPPPLEKVALVRPTVTPGECVPGSTTPTDATITPAVTPGITYSEPTLTPRQGTRIVEVTLKATPEPGKQLDEDNVPPGWNILRDGTGMFTGEIEQPECPATKVVPVDPTTVVNQCQPGDVEPADPTITPATTEGIDYQTSWAVDGDEVVFTATATAKPGYVIDKDNLPNGWSWNDQKTVAEFTKREPKPVCAKLVVPVNPTVTPGVCAPGATTPSDPTVELATTEGITYGTPEITVEGRTATVKVTATRKDGFIINGGSMPTGWTYNNDGTATYTTTVEQPVCDKPVTPVNPTVTLGTCAPGATEATEPTAVAATTEGITYSAPAIGKVQDNVYRITVTATPEAGYKLTQDNLPDGWTMNADNTSATYNTEVTNPVCDKPVIPADPTVEVGVCEPGAVEPTDPKITPATTEGIDYQTSWAVDGDEVVFTATATAKPGHFIDKDNLPNGWSWNDQKKVAEYTKREPKPVCAKPVVPVNPTVTPGVCAPGATTPSDPTVELATTEGITYGTPEITVEGRTATVKVIATRKDGFIIDGGKLPEGWVYNNDGTATFTTTVEQPKCDTPPAPPTTPPTTPAPSTPPTPADPSTPVTPVDPKVTPGVCKPGSPTPTPPTVVLPKVPGLVYGTPTMKVVGNKVRITLVVTPEPGKKIGDLGKGWTLNQDGTATFTYTGTNPVCGKKPGMPKTGD